MLAAIDYENIGNSKRRKETPSAHLMLLDSQYPRSSWARDNQQLHSGQREGPWVRKRTIEQKLHEEGMGFISDCVVTWLRCDC